MLEKIKRFFFIFLTTLTVSFLFKEISDYLDKQKILEKIKYSNNTLENFYLVSKANQTYTLIGSKMVLKGDEIFVENPQGHYEGEKGSFDLTSKESVYHTKEKVAKFYKDVIFTSKDINMKTEYIFIDTQKNIVYNDTDTLIYSKEMTTKGKNLLLDIEREFLKLDKVFSEYRGKNG